MRIRKEEQERDGGGVPRVLKISENNPRGRWALYWGVDVTRWTGHTVRCPLLPCSPQPRKRPEWEIERDSGIH